MIHGLILGGLGNQLFKVFATIAYSIEHSQPFVFFYSKTVNGRTTYWETFLHNLKKYTIDSMNLSQFIPIGTCMHNYEQLPPAESNKNYSLQYYLQSHKYFEKHEKEIYKLIGWEQQRELVKTKYSHYLAEESVELKMNFISIHFRFGDYKQIQYCHNLLTLDYYKRAIEKVCSTFHAMNDPPSFTFIYFYEKEDESMVNNIIDSLRETTGMKFIPVDTNIPDWEQMLLMSCCHSNIIANSTFSWWGAYSNPHQEKVVCYPATWFGPSLANNIMDDMFPKSWYKIG